MKEFVFCFFLIFRTLSGANVKTKDAVTIAKESKLISLFFEITWCLNVTVYFSLECESIENLDFFARLAGAKSTHPIHHPSTVSWKFIILYNYVAENEKD